MLKTLRDLIDLQGPAADALLTPEPTPISGAVRVLSWGKAIELILGKKRLRLYPEVPVNPSTDIPTKDWILVDPSRFFSDVAGFARIRNGETLMVGRGNELLDKIFEFPNSVMRRHLEVLNNDGEIILRPLDRESKALLCAVPESEGVDCISSRRIKNLQHLRAIFGGPIMLLEPKQALITLDQAYDILLAEAYRPKNSEDRPGGLLELPAEPTPIIVGDIHAQIDNLLNMLSRDGYLDALESGNAYLLFLGDIVHRERDDELEEMESSLLTLDMIFKLKIHFPKTVFQLRGNHESFGDEVGKGGVPQGRLLLQHSRALRGANYAERLAKYFELLAYVAKTKDFITCHAGPPRREVSLRKLINIQQHPKLAQDLVWNRLRRTGYPIGYGKRDVNAFREALGAKRDTPFIVSHSRLSLNGTIWTDVGEVPGHHIVFSANPGLMAIFIRSGHRMIPLEFPGESLLDFVNGIEGD
jgi:hypothetical protein